MSSSIPYRKAFYSNCGLKADILVYDNSKFDAQKHSIQLKEKRKDLAINSMILFTDVAYRLAITLACIMMAVTIGVAIYTVIVFLGNSKPIEGWTTNYALFIICIFLVFLQYQQL